VKTGVLTMDTSKSRLRRGVAGVALLGVLASCAMPSPTSNGGAVKDLPANNADALMGVAQTAEAEGDKQTALSLYQRAAAASPGDSEPLMAAGRLAAASGQHGEAARAYQLVVQSDPNNMDARYGLGRALAAQDLPNAALSHFEAMLRIDRGDARAYNGLGIAYDLLGDHQQAQRHYRTGLTIDGANVSLSNNLAYSLILSGDHAEAAGLLEQVVQKPDASQQSHRNLALAYNLMGRDEDSRAVVLGGDGVEDMARAITDYQAAAAPAYSSSNNATQSGGTAPGSTAFSATGPSVAAQAIPETNTGPRTATVVEQSTSFEADPVGSAPQTESTYRRQDEPADVTPRYISAPDFSLPVAEPASASLSSSAPEAPDSAAANTQPSAQGSTLQETGAGLQAQAAVKRPSTEERRIVSYEQSDTQSVSYSLADAPSLRERANAQGITNAPTLEDRFLNNN